MLDLIEYIETNNTLQICRCYGEGGFAQLPNFIDGLPVTALADHVFAREPSFVLRQVPRSFARFDQAEGEWRPVETPQPDGLTACCAQSVREIVLPASLQKVGNYAFYGCHALSRITIPAALSNLGSGAFVDCNHVKEVVIALEENASGSALTQPLPALRQVLAEISYEVEIRIRDSAGRDLLRLHFPEYYEDSQENTPARIFVMKFEGTGFKYRQCFINGGIDLARYDSLFYEACVQEYVPTVMQIALDRLFYPAQLSDAAREKYIGYLLEEPERLAKWCMPEGNSGNSDGWDAYRIMDFLCREERLEREALGIFMDAAIRAQRADVVSLLQDYRWTHFSKQSVRTRYEL